jgi:uncharacterized damage-inducible protein DinB
MQSRLEELVKYVDAQRTALLNAASAVPDERWAERPAPERWSVAEVLEHLSKVEKSCARAIAKCAAEGRAAGVGPEREEGSMLQALEGKRVTDRSNRLKASERVQPAGGMDRARALAAITASRAELRQAMHDADGLALCEIRQPFGTLGDFDLYQWILFVGQHEARHRKQVDEIAGQLGATAS